MDEFQPGLPDKEKASDQEEQKLRNDGNSVPEEPRDPAASIPNTQLSLWPADEGPRSEEIPELPLEPPQYRPPRDPPWSLADLGLFIIFAAASLMIANLIAVGIFSTLRHELNWRVSMEKALNQTPWVVSMQTIWEVLWLAFIYLVISKKYDRPFWRAVKWLQAPRPPGLYLIAGALLAIAAQLALNLFPSQKHLPIEKLFSSTGAAYLLAVFGICIAPFIEELVFRGFFYPVFERLWGLAAAVVLTGILFASIHVPQLSGGWQEIIAIFIVGMVFSYCRGKTGSLVPPYLMHLAYNTSLFTWLYVSTDRFRNLKG